jgi:regulator of Ty1 transposition protein 103
MTSFTDEILISKLTHLNGTSQSIQTLSHWVMYHRKQYKQAIEIWHREFFKAPRERLMPLLYLANDIMQNSRKKGAEFCMGFSKVIPAAIQHVYTKEADEPTRKAIMRLLDVWQERMILSGSLINDLRKTLLTAVGPPSRGAPAASSAPPAPGSYQHAPVTPPVPPGGLPPLGPLEGLMRDEAELKRQSAETQAMAAALPALAAELSALAANEAPMDQATRQRTEGLLAQIESYRARVDLEIALRSRMLTSLVPLIEAQKAGLDSATARLSTLTPTLEGPVKSLRSRLQAAALGEAHRLSGIAPSGSTLQSVTQALQNPIFLQQLLGSAAKAKAANGDVGASAGAVAKPSADAEEIPLNE